MFRSGLRSVKVATSRAKHIASGAAECEGGFLMIWTKVFEAAETLESCKAMCPSDIFQRRHESNLPQRLGLDILELYRSG